MTLRFWKYISIRIDSSSFVWFKLMKAVDGVTFYDDQAYGKHRSKQPVLREEYERQSDDNSIRRFSQKAKIQLIHCSIDLVEVIDRDEVKLEELIAQIKINECKVDHKKSYGKCEFRLKNQIEDIKEEESHSVGNDVNLRPKNGFLLEEPRIVSICHIADPMNGQTDIVISCLLYTSPSPRDRTRSRMPSSA